MGFENFQPSHWYFTGDPNGHGLLISIITLAILLTFFLLGFLLFRLVCYRRRNLPGVTSATWTTTQHTISIPAAAAAAASSSSVGLDATTINSLPIFIHGSSVCSDDIDDQNTTSFQDSECSICLALYEDDEMVKVMPECQHSFHSDCVDEWLRNRPTCPLCRLSLCSSSGSVIE